MTGSETPSHCVVWDILSKSGSKDSSVNVSIRIRGKQIDIAAWLPLAELAASMNNGMSSLTHSQFVFLIAISMKGQYIYVAIVILRYH